MYSEVIDRFKDAFAAVLPDLSADELYWRMHFLVGTLAYCMSGTDMMRLISSSRMPHAPEVDKMTRRLTLFLTAGLQAGQSAAPEPATKGLRNPSSSRSRLSG